jgi:hypothetical protein
MGAAVTAGPAAPAVSVVMPVYNGAAYLAEAVESILAQTFGDFELLAVEGNSTDASPAILAGYAVRDGRVRVVPQTGHGLIAALNQGVGAARGEFIARMDADDVALPERFARQVRFLREHPTVAAVGTAMQAIGPDGIRYWRMDYPTHPAAVRDMLTKASCLGHPSVMARRAALDAVGGYRSALRDAEDYDLWLRLADRFELANLPDVLMRYRCHPGQSTLQRLRTHAAGVAAARAAARFRTRGEPDPTAGAAELTPELLARLGVTSAHLDAETLRGQIAVAAGCVRFGRLDEALSAIETARTMPCPNAARALRGEILWNAAKIRLCRREWRAAAAECGGLLTRHFGFALRRALDLMARTLRRSG